LKTSAPTKVSSPRRNHVAKLLRETADGATSVAAVALAQQLR